MLHTTIPLELVLFQGALDEIDDDSIVERHVLVGDKLDGLLRHDPSEEGSCGGKRGEAATNAIISASSSRLTLQL
jgi:hypothetical protein